MRVLIADKFPKDRISEIQALGFEVPKGFIYFAMFFALGVELIKMRYESNLRRQDEMRADIGA